MMIDEENFSTCPRCNELYDVVYVYENDVKYCPYCGEPLYKKLVR